MTQRLFNHVSTGIMWYVFSVICDIFIAVDQNLPKFASGARMIVGIVMHIADRNVGLL